MLAIAAVWCFYAKEYSIGVYLMILGVADACITVFLIRIGNISICATDDGIYVVGYKKFLTHFYAWNSFRHLYFLSNSKNTHFIILSLSELTVKQRKRILKKIKICTNNYVVIPLDPMQNTSLVTETIHRKTGDGDPFRSYSLVKERA